MEFKALQYAYLLDGCPPTLGDADKKTINDCCSHLDSMLKAAEDTRETSAEQRMHQAVQDFVEKPNKQAVELIRTCALEIVTGDKVATLIRKACDDVAISEGRKLVPIVKVVLDALAEGCKASALDYEKTVAAKARAIGMPFAKDELEGRLQRSLDGYVDRKRKLDLDSARAFEELESLGYALDPRNNYVI